MNSKITLLFGMLAFTAAFSFAQPEIHSGILHTDFAEEELNLIKIHCDEAVDPANQLIVIEEYEKYSEYIASVTFDDTGTKIYIKYTSGIDPNMLLGILERVTIFGYYLSPSDVPIYYVKTGTENFKR